MGLKPPASHRISEMRVMQIPRFPRKVEILDFDFFVRGRLTQAIVLWSEQAIALVGYMAWPNDPGARAASEAVLQGWFEGSKAIPPRLRQIQTDWVRIADIFTVHYDLAAGRHQQRRGGPSIGKAVTFSAASIRAKGANAANLWRAWTAYKDVAHLVTAATVINLEARRMASVKPFGDSGLLRSQLHPFLIAMLMPDFVISLALSYQEYGISSIPQSRDQPMLDPKTLWRIPSDIGVVAVPPPVRKVGRTGIAILNARRAGNRGKSKVAKTTPVSD
jgi:hypothetical protein